MQKVIMLPRRSGLKQVILCKTLVLFNETFAPIGKSEMKPVGVLWYEAIGCWMQFSYCGCWIQNILEDVACNRIHRITFIG